MARPAWWWGLVFCWLLPLAQMAGLWRLPEQAPMHLGALTMGWFTFVARPTKAISDGISQPTVEGATQGVFWLCGQVALFAWPPREAVVRLRPLVRGVVSTGARFRGLRL